MREPKRRFWRFHLSTAVASMLAAGGMLALNMLSQPARLADDAFINFNYIETQKGGVHYFGWPEYAIACDFHHHMISNGTALVIDASVALFVLLRSHGPANS